MSMASIAWNILAILFFVFWITCIYRWIRRGCPIPRYVHILAILMFLAGVITQVVFISWGLFSVKTIASCLLFPPAAVYIAWVCMLGPALEEDQRE